MKILYVINQISDWSGDSRLLWLTVKLMQKRGHEVAIATTDANPFRDQASSEKYYPILKKLQNHNKDFVIINDVPVFSIHSITSHFGMYSFNAGTMAKKIIKNFDLVHIYSWYHHIGIEFFKVSKKYNVPLIFTAMATLQNDAQSYYKIQKSIVNLFFTKKIINYASILHSVGQSEIETYIHFGGKKEKIIQIENGIDLNDYKLKNLSNILKRCGINDKPYILFLGRIHPKKGLELLLKSFNELTHNNNEIYLIIAGSGESNYVQKIKKYVQDLGLSNKVKFTGLVSHDEKLTLLKSAKLFSLTSKSDIHPVAVQEALTMGIPVVISKESDYPEVEQYDTGIIVNLNMSEIVNAFRTLLNNPSLDIISNNAKNLIKEKYLVEDQIIKFEQIYQTILSKK